jgi:hypothetical protein
MPIRQSIAKGRTFNADVENRENFFAADSYGVGIYPAPSLDVVTYNADYNFTGFGGGIYTPRHSTGTYYDPKATEPYTDSEELRSSPTADYFNAIDRVKFTNGVYIISPYGGNDPAAAVEGLYDYIGRETPDRSGFEFWLDGLDNGVSLAAIVDEFIAAKDEAANTGLYGIVADPTDNREFVEAIYHDVLGYGGTEEGIAFWSGNLDSGAANRGDVLTEFVKVAGDAPAYNAWIDWA